MWDFMWCMAKAPVDPNCSTLVSQMLFPVRDCVAERAFVCLGDGAEVDEEGLVKTAVMFNPAAEDLDSKEVYEEGFEKTAVMLAPSEDLDSTEV